MSNSLPLIFRNRASLLGVRIKDGTVSAKTSLLERVMKRPGPRVQFAGSTASLESGGAGQSEVWFVVRNGADEVVIPVEPEKATEMRKFVAEYNHHAAAGS